MKRPSLRKKRAKKTAKKVAKKAAKKTALPSQCRFLPIIAV
jgi:hypothetical protein